MTQPRTQARSGYDIAVRMSLAESDLDTHDAEYLELKAELNSIKKVLVGMLISLSTGAVMLAINLFVAK